MRSRHRIRRRVRRRAAPRVRRQANVGTHAARQDARAQMRDAGGLMIGGAHDPAEKAADRMAQQVLAAGVAGPAATSAPGAVHRKYAACAAGGAPCPACDGSAEKAVKRQAGAAPVTAPGASAAPASPSAAKALGAMGTGRPLARAERAFFEPRFGRDFSGVRVHEDTTADRAARAIDARAFTHGQDIAFARGERARGGAPLMAHELAHVAGDGSPGRLRRATLATADHSTVGTYKKVPAAHTKEANAAIAIIKNQAKKKKCKDYFKDNCSAGGGSLADAISGATIYWMDNNSKQFGSSQTRTAAADPRTIAYNTYAFNIGRWEIAATLLHEMFHTCILGTIPDEEVVAETSVEECQFYVPWSLGHSPGTLDVGDKLWVHGFQFGPKQDADHYIKLGSTKITSYDKWKLDPSNSWVDVEFKVPKAVNTNSWFSKTVDVVAVNHGTESNKRPLKVHP